MKKLKLFIGIGVSLLGALLIGTAQTQSAAAETGVSYRTHVQNIGWQDFLANGAMSGTTGKGWRLEGIELKLTNPEYTGGITYRTHVQNIGWQGFLANGAMSGTTGKGLRLEAIEIKLTGELANHYDVQYRTHVQNVGWQPFVVNGATSGTTGKGLRLEGIEIKLIKKANNATQPSTPSTPENKSIRNVASAYAIQSDVILNGTGSGFHAKIILLTSQSAISFGIQYDTGARAPYTSKPAFLIENIVNPSVEEGNNYNHTGYASVGKVYQLMITLQNNGSGDVYVDGKLVGNFSNAKLANTQVYARIQSVGKQNGDSVDSRFSNILIKSNGIVYQGQTSSVYEQGFSTNTRVNEVTDSIYIGGKVSNFVGNWSTATPFGKAIQFY